MTRRARMRVGRTAYRGVVYAREPSGRRGRLRRRMRLGAVLLTARAR